MKVKISAVSYSNTLPFLHGLKYSAIAEEIELSLDIPSDCAKKLLENEVDLGLVPVAVLPQLTEHYIVSNYCIGASGKVDSVLLLSEVPLDEIKTIGLDYQSRTSVALVQILAKELWSIQPEWVATQKGYEEQIAGDKAAVVIGDRAFRLKTQFKHVFDLSNEWQKLTGLPFVFACWVSNKKLPETFVANLNKAFEEGIGAIDTIIKHHDFPHDLADYLKNKIDYHLDDQKKEALELFLDKIAQAE